ncbi:MAG: class I SAM-dependent methyltransferase [Proteobacteria bacterium]|nr:class I SAM-dependent methyltransferase [Pseudomonadota bacterium]
MVTIYQDYQDEPGDVFLPLPEDLAAGLYALEMENFSEDSVFFAKVLPQHGAILEMGCGTGRVARYLANENRTLTGIDISLPMLRLAAKHLHPHCSFYCMDMLAPAFRKPFDAIFIPYNTLNLLTTRERIFHCLLGCQKNLHGEGTLIVQLFIPTKAFLDTNRTIFQFQMFDRPGGGRIIKEILKKYLPESETILLEERYRIRPMQKGLVNEDFHAVSSIAAFALPHWLTLFAEANFTPQHIWGTYACGPYDATASSCCLLVLKQHKPL